MRIAPAAFVSRAAAWALPLIVGAGTQPAPAAIDVRLSVKFILSSNGARPTGPPAGSGNIDVSTTAGFDGEVAHGNNALIATGRGYRLKVVEYIDIQPSAPSGEAANYWYNLDARSNRATFEQAASNDTSTWRWNGSALNIYVNNSGSGQCSFVGGGSSISLGGTLFAKGTVLHEVGHFVNLLHTHTGDPDCSTFTPGQPLNTNLGDGDQLASTVPDHPCFSRDQLSMANFNANYDSLNAQQQAAVNTTWLNVMSYHQEEVFVADQMDIWADTANESRQFAIAGRTVFVDRSSTCISIDNLGPDYRWWIDRNPPPGITWGSSKPVTVRIEPPAPPPPPQWPPPGWSSDWPPNFELPRPPAPWYPSDWAWPPGPPPPIDVCFGGPRKSLADGLSQANSGDVVMLRAGTYHEAQRITKAVTLGATRGTVTIR